MKAYVTSIGEQTTEICCEQLKRYGFEVVLMDEKEEWVNKYKRFLTIAEGDCLRVDADIIVNRNISKFYKQAKEMDCWLADTKVYDLYRNGLSCAGVVYYSKEGLKYAKDILFCPSAIRPERSFSKEIGHKKDTLIDMVVGIHGFFQDDETMYRAKENKKNRGQEEKYNYDFDLAFKLKSLYEKN